ncbi:MAG: FAD-dependent oxidoreductase, partial [Deltaproteobacteria bacterium]|nr:FAD-dependent oxidoreductase [Deltaproteobacteria bacterium]
PVGDIAKDDRNLPAEFVAMMAGQGNPGNCWVSKNCFRPDAFHDDVLEPLLTQDPALAANLSVLRRSVVKQVGLDEGTLGRRIRDVTVITRTPRTDDEWGAWLSDDLHDWYGTLNSARFTKEVVRLQGPGGQAPVVIDATEFGDVLVLAGAPYLQGVEVVDGSTEIADDTCGQAMVFPFVQHYESGVRSEPANPFTVDHPDFYDMGAHDWDQIWRYRRIVDGPHDSGAHYNDYSLQNWFPGNDYGFGYMLVSKDAAADQRADWRGGIDLSTLAAAEHHAYGWHYWLKAREPNGRADFITLDRELLGTETGLSKLPYVRDTRRSVGLNNFVLASRHLRGEAADLTGTRFSDRIAIGAYAIDIHGLDSGVCSLPSYVGQIPHETMPYFIPFRAITNRDVDNLMVAGKTMAQSFVANAAIRLQPIEWSSGIGAGAAAAHMHHAGHPTTTEVLIDIAAVQARIRNYAPTEWTIGGAQVPAPGETLPPAPVVVHCADDARFDEGYGFCVTDVDAYGPFTHTMTERCQQFGGGPACTELREVTVDGRTIEVTRWGKSFARNIRGDGPCPLGAAPDPAVLGHCAERYTAPNGEQFHEVYGPFGGELVERCIQAQGGDACYTHRWSAPFFLSLVD